MENQETYCIECQNTKSSAKTAGYEVKDLQRDKDTGVPATYWLCSAACLADWGENRNFLTILG